MTRHNQSRRGFLAAMGAAGAGVLLFGGGAMSRQAVAANRFAVTRTPQQWRRILSPMQYRVLRESATERPGSSPLNAEKRRGTYACAGCDQALYSSATKFESGTGWPSFYAPIRGAIGTKPDAGIFGTRTEVHCSRCGGHLGHVFDDGPKPTGLRYCMNGAAMRFRPA
jgi:peptide-methionine (R)-S-oxide reductase